VLLPDASSEPRVSRKGNNPPLDGGKQSLRSRESRVRAASLDLDAYKLDTYLDVVVARCGGCAITLRPNPLSLSLFLSPSLSLSRFAKSLIDDFATIRASAASPLAAVLLLTFRRKDVTDSGLSDHRVSTEPLRRRNRRLRECRGSSKSSRGVEFLFFHYAAF